MSRLSVVAVSIASLAAGAVAAGWWTTENGFQSAKPSSGVPRLNSAAPIEARVAALEQALEIERQARQLLQEELIVLTDRLEVQADSGPERDGDLLISADADADADAQSGSGVASARRASSRSRFADEEQRRDRLVQNGFTAGEADQILRREAALQMEMLQARYEAQRNGEPFDFSGRSDALRDELGDEAYSRYLEANGRPTSITVSRVYEGSPALAAGLQSGDQILRYDGQRVFSMNEVADLTMEGNVGEGIVVDIVRDGMPMQVSMPRGPLGVAGGRRFGQ